MSSVVFSKTYKAPPFCEKEILRYAGCKAAGGETEALLRECIDQTEGKLTYKVCYRNLSVTTEGAECDFGVFRLNSAQLAHHLEDCQKVILFAATIGVEIDRLIAGYGRLSPSKALMFQAIGAERIEALCDAFCADVAKQYHMAVKPRFSPGYGDLPLECQKEIFAILDCERSIGLTLSDSLMMLPTKSVTAFVGLGGKDKQNSNKCSACDKPNCTFRGV